MNVLTNRNSKSIYLGIKKQIKILSVRAVVLRIKMSSEIILKVGK